MQDEYVTFSAAWFTLSLINAGLAQAKNRSGLNWWFVSLFLGPFATLLIVAWRPGTRSDVVLEGRMTRPFAIALGIVIIIAAFAILGLLASGAGPR